MHSSDIEISLRLEGSETMQQGQFVPVPYDTDVVSPVLENLRFENILQYLELPPNPFKHRLDKNYVEARNASRGDAGSSSAKIGIG